MTSLHRSISTSAPQATPAKSAFYGRTTPTDKQPAALMTAMVYPVLSIEQLCRVDFAPPYNCNYFSWSPAKAFKARDSGQMGVGGELETLHTYLTTNTYRAIAADCLLEVHHTALPNPNASIAIYRVVSRESGTDFGAILPGAAVSESVSHAQWFADVDLVKNARLLSTKVYPDELLTHGNPHEFIYIPRSVKGGYARYLADVKREQESELARVRKGLPPLR